MKKYIIVIISALALAVQSHAANTFAIFADEQTYLHCQSALGQYRDVLISEGLDARIYHADWQSPDEVKDIIRKLASRSGRQSFGGLNLNTFYVPLKLK